SAARGVLRPPARCDGWLRGQDGNREQWCRAVEARRRTGIGQLGIQRCRRTRHACQRVSWSEALLALLVSHAVGDVLLQTDWQARMKGRGVRDPVGRRALSRHISTYILA